MSCSVISLVKYFSAAVTGNTVDQANVKQSKYVVIFLTMYIAYFQLRVTGDRSISADKPMESDHIGLIILIRV